MTNNLNGNASDWMSAVVAARPWGYTPAQTAFALEPRREDECAQLDGSCREPAEPGDIWCTVHMPRLANVGGA